MSRRPSFAVFLVGLLCASAAKHVTKRALLFPRATVLQFTVGVSAPALLPTRSINLSLCMQVNYDLPYNITRATQPMTVQAKSGPGFDLSRDTSYRYIVQFLDGFGLSGEQCLYRLVCELSEYPLHLDHSENLLEKIAHFVFTPSLEMPPNSTGFAGRLMEAEELGRRDGGCGRIYSGCIVSLVGMFTEKYMI